MHAMINWEWDVNCHDGMAMALGGHRGKEQTN